ncbi:11519_t:CDS:2 [Acaulospora colombiana]|uniref:11519_t:CDS:1 n=1 Tax=Acaulospora colombiana TaxID=27376 RepID=A0ACA9KRY6_9GLOM|nr:11519_t:CDS:2 [Acaulospora colombiana]
MLVTAWELVSAIGHFSMKIDNDDNDSVEFWKDPVWVNGTKREKAELLAKEAGLKARIVELEQTLQDYEAMLANLEQKKYEKAIIHMFRID